MSRKKCLLIMIVSVVLIAAETLGYLMFIRPQMRLDDFYKAAEAGDIDKMSKLYEKLSGDDREDAVSMLKDMSVSITNEYLGGADHGIASYSVMNSKLWPVAAMIDTVREFSDEQASGLTEELNKCYFHANSKFLPEQYERVAAEIKNSGADKAKDAAKIFSDIFGLKYGEHGDDLVRILIAYGGDGKYKDAISESLGKYLEKKYESFVDEAIDKETISAYLEAAGVLFKGRALETCVRLRGDFSAVGDYDKYLQEQELLYNDGKYLEVIKNIDAFVNNNKDDELFPNSEDSFETLRELAYEEGKDVYPDTIYDYIKDGKVMEAENLLKEVEEVYGKDIDIASVKNFLRSDWKTAYYNYMKYWEEGLQAAKNDGVSIGEYNNCADVDISANKPDLLTLVDLGGDGVPEMILHNSRSGYSYIYSYTGGLLVFSGCLKVMSYGNDKKYIIAEPYSGSAGAAAYKRELCHFDQSTGRISVDRVIFRNRDYSYVNIDGVEYSKDAGNGGSDGSDGNGNGNSGGSGSDGSGAGTGNSGGSDGGASPAQIYDKTLNEIEDIGNGGGSDPDPSGSVTVSRYFEYIYHYGSEE